jgi:Zn-dependent peptidase ImmA (M78 family)
MSIGFSMLQAATAPVSPNRPDYTRVKREVSRIIGDFSLIEPPVNPVDIARQLGIKVYFVKFDGDSKNISGFYDCDDESIYVNHEEYPLRQTFTVAHELGHKIMHSDWAKSADYKVLLRDAEYDGSDSHEKEANAFAAHLLVPRFMLDRYWKSTTVEGLSQLFAVSVPMIKNRLAFEYGV